MKKILFSLCALLIFVLTPSPIASAFDPNAEVCRDGAARQSSVCDTDRNPIVGNDGILLEIVNIIALVAGFAAVIVIIIAGFQFVFSNGDSSKISTARNALVFAIVGLIIIALSRVIIGFVLSSL